MVANFAHGGAAINQLSELAGAKMSVHPIDLDTPTADFTQGPAMSEAEAMTAIQVGWEAVDPDADLLYPRARADVVRLLLSRQVELPFSEGDVGIRVAVADLVAPGELLIQ